MARSPSRSAAAATEPERWRLFVAIELPDAVRKALRGPLRDLALIDDIRPTPVEQIHLTLHFLGSVETDSLEAIAAALKQATSGQAHFRLRARGVNAFGGRRRPRVLWAAFADTGIEEIKALRQRTARALAGVGFEIEPNFRPHLTLGRARRPVGTSASRALQDWYARWTEEDFGTLPVRQIALKRSQLGGGPARHSAIATFQLQ